MCDMVLDVSCLQQKSPPKEGFFVVNRVKRKDLYFEGSRRLSRFRYKRTALL